eukprot:CAMPEP_0198730830 /NCGR_PEP_ID=MMETSP1475-20131203/26548_1 /TAXON_ID= ORGANISM="Unidentified sp., Strain CCMP1999" /NCGR_SAMPLE_ID=MMETSP1475 /ASSEMBLY_ACC=CAM_ASM_001111 /LENGTH=360 /DNA_ID=CAMNT_0044493695 /DNA_START=171 /DNA_END=1253 /DNA_ORIENTATION=-
MTNVTFVPSCLTGAGALRRLRSASVARKRNVVVCVAQPQPKTVDVYVLGQRLSLPGRALLLSVPFFWGSFYPAVRYLYSLEHAPMPAVFNAERVLVAAGALSFSMISTLRREKKLRNIREDISWILGGAELGAYVFLSTISQVIGLQHVDAGRAAFLNQLQTVLVPALAFTLCGDRNVSRRTWAASMVSLAGVGLLAVNGSGQPFTFEGDGLELLSALFFSFFVLRIGHYAKIVSAPILAGSKMLGHATFACMYAAFCVFHSPATVHFAPDGGTREILAWACVVLWTGGFSSAFSAWAQVIGQKIVSTSEAAIVFATQPVIAALMSWMFLGENINMISAIGGSSVLAGVFLASTQEDRKP